MKAPKRYIANARELFAKSPLEDDRYTDEKKDAYRFAVRYSALNLRQRALLASAVEKPQEIYTIETHANVHGVTYQTAHGSARA